MAKQGISVKEQIRPCTIDEIFFGTLKRSSERTRTFRIPGRVLYSMNQIGAVAQLGERCVRNAEVEGSTPFRSTSSV